MASDSLTPPDAPTATEQAFNDALKCQQAGELERAAELYQSILLVAPKDPTVNHNLGVVAVQLEQYEAALHYFGVALDADSASWQFWLSYIDALHRAGKMADAHQTLALARKQGLAGDAVDALEIGLLAETSKSPHETASRRPTRRPHQEPSPNEMKVLTAAFSGAGAADLASRSLEMIRRYPRHWFGWKALGVAYQRAGRNSDALVPMQKTVELHSGDTEAQNNLGIVLQGLGRFAEAEASYRRAVQRSPRNAQAHGNLGSVLKELGRLEEAEASCRRAIKLDPKYAKAHNNLGVILHDQKRFEEAETAYRRAIALNSNYGEPYNNLGNTLIKLGRLDDAEACYLRALEIVPASIEALCNLSLIELKSRRYANAEAHCRRALELRPGDTSALKSLGRSLLAVGRYDEAVKYFNRVVQIEPNSADAYDALGSALHRAGKSQIAVEYLRMALQIDPEHLSALLNLGLVLVELGQIVEAEAIGRRALAIEPGSAAARSMLGFVLMYCWNVDEATDCFREVVRIAPGNATDHSNFLFGLSKSAAIDARTLNLEHRKFGDYFEAPYLGKTRQYVNTPDQERCLRIGMVSGDFRRHAMASFLEPMLPVLERSLRISLHAYSNNVVEDHATRRLRRHFAHWQVVAHMTDDDLAEKIRDDGIDILIDLSGHTAKNRLLVFARKPAPIQVSWIGYPGTTGLGAMDYYLADKLLFPSDKFSWQFAEKLVYLPTTAPFLPEADAPEVGPLPALSKGHITLGSFNQPNKINCEVVALWSRLLRALPDSRMLIAALPREIRRETLLQWFADEGVAADRLQLRERCDMKAYLALHQQVDICLDTFPYSGGTTTNHALWMGVPTLTVVGETPPSWQGARLMNSVGLGQYVALDADDFVEKGVRLARDLEGLAEVRAGLRDRLAASPTGNPELIANSFLVATRIMWRRWCSGLPTESFEVTEGDIKQMGPEVLQ